MLKSKMYIPYYVFFCGTTTLVNYQILISQMKKFKRTSYNPINLRISASDSSLLNTQNSTCMIMIPNYKTQT
jgi:hypothetical protein